MIATGIEETMDIYASTQEIIEALAAAGLGSDARELDDAFSGGSTSTEIIMRIGMWLERFDIANKPVDLGTKRKIRDTLEVCRRVMQDGGRQSR